MPTKAVWWQEADHYLQHRTMLYTALSTRPKAVTLITLNQPLQLMLESHVVKCFAVLLVWTCQHEQFNDAQTAHPQLTGQTFASPQLDDN